MEPSDLKHNTKSFAAKELNAALVCSYWRRLIVLQWWNRRGLINGGTTMEFNQRSKQNRSPHLTSPRVRKLALY